MKNGSFLLLILSGGLGHRSTLIFMSALLLTLASAALSSLAPLLLATATDILAGSQNIADTMSSVAWMAALYICSIGFTKIFNTISLYLQSMLRLQLVEAISKKYFALLCEKDSQFYVRNSLGELAQRLNQASNDLYTVVRNIAFNILAPAVQLIFAVFIVSNILSGIIGIVFLIYILLFLINNHVFLDRLSSHRTRVMDAGRRSYGVLIDSVMNIVAARQYNGFDILMKRYKTTLDDDRAVQKTYWQLTITMLSVNSLLFVLMFGWCIYWMLTGSKDTQTTPGNFVLFASYILLLAGPIEMLGSTLSEVHQSWHSVAAFVKELFQGKSTNQSRPSLEADAYSVELDQLEFDYPDAAHFHFGPISLCFKSGEKIALLGTSGSGKSTLAKLLTGDYAPSRGAIRILGNDTSAVSQASLNELIGIVSQETHIFSDTVRFNMQIADSSASDSEILRALDLAGFDVANKDGRENISLDAQLGERGLKLSGGQRQRLALARLFLREPRILIIDEGTSSLDVLAERRITDNITRHFRNCTIISISHRTSALAYSERVIVIHNGKLQADGPKTQIALSNDYLKSMMAMSNITK
ncbi:ABC transporter ATP-binding protein [Achromobacter sp. RTa]|uniref:ABC transporter ATP-binding protein n=1 Tax=Achromobacter sp. RTa TaxID=1532557 RepID=UPI0009DD7264|nr:ABC transporter ATP-binding protein [Achromobacter sp. RTa]